jgi:aconitate hydratase
MQPHVGGAEALEHGSIVIAAITSCTNTSNPSVMLAAGLLAKRAVERGLSRKPWVKTSLAPGSRVVMAYYERAGYALSRSAWVQSGRLRLRHLYRQFRPLPSEVSEEIRRRNLVVAAALSGNRNFEGRIHSEVRANYLMSPPLVMAFALAGRINIDLETEPLGRGQEGRPMFLRDLWPSQEEIQRTLQQTIGSELFRENYREIFAGDEQWRTLAAPSGDI